MRDLSAENYGVLLRLVELVRLRTRRDFADLRQSFVPVVFRLRIGVPWRDLPPRFRPWAWGWALHRLWTRLGISDALLAEARAARVANLAEV